MSQALPLPPPGFDALSPDEQIDYVQSLWDHIAARPEDVPVPDWHREILAEYNDGGRLELLREEDCLSFPKTEHRQRVVCRQSRLSDV